MCVVPRETLVMERVALSMLRAWNLHGTRTDILYAEPILPISHCATCNIDQPQLLTANDVSMCGCIDFVGA
jgi:hypothetical protein